MHHLSTPVHQLPHFFFVDISFEWIYDLSVHSCIKLTALYSSHMCILTTSWIPCVMLVHLVVWCYQNCFRLMRICSCWPLVPWKLEWINCWCSYIKYKPLTDHLLCARTIPLQWWQWSTTIVWEPATVKTWAEILWVTSISLEFFNLPTIPLPPACKLKACKLLPVDLTPLLLYQCLNSYVV